MTPNYFGALKPGERLRKLREKKELTQEEAAKRAGIRRDTLCKLETGKTGLTDFYLRVLADLYDTSSDYLIGRTEKSDLNASIPSCDELGLTDDAIFTIKRMKEKGDYGRLLSQILNSPLLEQLLIYTKQSFSHWGRDNKSEYDFDQIQEHATADGYFLLNDSQCGDYCLLQACRCFYYIIRYIAEGEWEIREQTERHHDNKRDDQD